MLSGWKVLGDPVSQVASIAFVNSDVAAEGEHVIAKAIDRFIITLALFVVMYEPVRSAMRKFPICIAVIAWFEADDRTIVA